MNLLGVILTIVTIGNPATFTQEISFSHPSAQRWMPLTDSTEVPFKSECWVRVHLNGELSEGLVLQGGNWYMRGMTYYDENMVEIGTGNHLLIESNANLSEIIIHYPFIDEKTASINLFIFDQTEFLKVQSRKNYFQIGFQSIYFFFAVTLLLFALRSKDFVYWHFFFYVVSTAYFFAYQYGLLGVLLPFIDDISPTWLWISSASLSMAYAFFAQSFLSLRKNDLIAHRAFNYGKYFIIMVVVSETVAHLVGFDLQHLLFYKILVVIIEISIMGYVVYRVYLLNDILSRIFLAGMCVVAIASLSAQLLSTLRLTVETNYFIQIGLLIDIFIFTVGLSIRIGGVYKAREKAQQSHIDQLKLNEEIQLKYAQELEETVVQRTGQLNTRNKENELLLKEVHHRVKNNLQMISSLLNMQKRRLKDAKSRDMLKLTQNRVLSIGLIHEHLYQRNNFSSVDLSMYINDLVNMLILSIHEGTKPEINIRIEDIETDIDTSVLIGLVMNELVTNAIKYAFPTTQNPALEIVLTREDDKLKLFLSDNGKSNQTIKMGFGWTIIQSTIASLNGTYDIKYEHGVHVEISLQEMESKKSD